MAEKKPKAEEFFYTIDDRDDSIPRDADLHNPILRAVDYPIDEDIMGPIREKHRKAYLAEQMATQKAARLKSQWAREKARSLALLEKYDPNQPRAPSAPGHSGGEFASTGGGGDSKADTSKGGGFKLADGSLANSVWGVFPNNAKDKTAASALLHIEEVGTDDLYALVDKSEPQAEVAEAKIAKMKAEGAPDSQKTWKLPDGSYAPDRIPEHIRIRTELMPNEQIAAAKPRAGERPTLYLLGGRGGSGKGWYTKKGSLAPAMKNSVYINNDDVKGAFREWQGWNAGYLHEEASDIAEDMERFALDNGLNTIIDMTMKSEGSVQKRIAAFKAAGYKISGHYMYASPAMAAKRALERFVGGNEEDGKGRYVPPSYSLQSTTNENNFDNFRKDMDYWEVYNNQGKSPVLHSRKGGK